MESVNISFSISKSNSGSQKSLKPAARSNNVGISDFYDGVYFFCFDSINSTKQDVEIMYKCLFNLPKSIWRKFSLTNLGISFLQEKLATV